MENFVFSSRAKTVTLSFMAIGLFCLVLTYFADGGEGHHMRFWTNFLHNSVFFLGIAALAGFALAAFTTAYAGWFVQFKRVWESFSMFLLPGMFLMGVIIAGLWLHSHHLYHWNDPVAVASDEILTHKSSFLNKWWYTLATVGFVGIWYFFLGKMRNISIAEDNDDRDAKDANFSYHKRYKKYAAIFLPIFGFTSAAVIWQWIMSIDSHWYSTMFAWYATASLFVAMTALTIMLLIYLKSRGYYAGVNAEHFHDLGKYLFAISIFWAYVWFSQFMLIWYANVGEETIYFRERMDNYPVLFWGNLVLNLLLPFFILMRNDTKRKMGTLFFASALVFFGHWFDFFNMIKPGARITLEEMAMHHGGEHGEDHAVMGALDEGHGDEGQGDMGHGDAEAGHDNNEHPDAVESSTPTTSEFQGGGPGNAAENDELATAGPGNDDAVFAPGAYVQTQYVDEMDMDGQLIGGGDHDGLDTSTFKSGYTIPGLLEIGTFLGFLGGFLFFVLGNLEKARLEPKHDPYLEESIHHHT